MMIYDKVVIAMEGERQKWGYMVANVIFGITNAPYEA